MLLVDHLSMPRPKPLRSAARADIVPGVLVIVGGTSAGYELAVELTQNDGTTYQVIYFDQEIEDAIFFDLAGFSGYLQDEASTMRLNGPPQAALNFSR